jgi:two-component system, chemotaxis family, sensor kinase CheA
VKADLALLRRLGALKEALQSGEAQRITETAGEVAGSVPGDSPLGRVLGGLLDPAVRDAAGEAGVALALELAERWAFDPEDAEALEGLLEWGAAHGGAASGPGADVDSRESSETTAAGQPADLMEALNEAAMLLVEAGTDDRSMVAEAASHALRGAEPGGSLAAASEAVLDAPDALAEEWALLCEIFAERLERAVMEVPDGEVVPAATEAPAAPGRDPLPPAPSVPVAGPASVPTQGAPGVAPDMAAELVADKAPVAGSDGAPDGPPMPDPAPVPAFSLLPPEVDRTLLEEFLEEAGDHLGGAEESLLALEVDPDDMEAVNVVFRAFHTIKGVAGFLDLGTVVEVAHHAETLLARVREGEIRFEGHITDLTLQAADLLKALFRGIRGALQGGVGGGLPPRFDEVMEALKNPLAAGGTPAPHAAARPPVSSEAAQPVPAARAVGSPAAPAPSAAGTSGPGAPTLRNSDEGGDSGGGSRDASVRVRTERLDRLVDLVGELVIAQSMVVQDPTVEGAGGELATKVSRASKILRDLQDLSTSMRMVPLKPAFLKVSRVVRDVSRRSGKQVEFVQQGEETEIDRSMVDILADPLIHMVRNSVDHGIESAAERRAAGKPESGTVRLRAYQASGRVVVEISDDGKGLDRDRILAKARERRLVEGDRNLSDAEVFALIFEPGFSTAEQVTDISGRGVGMDVVRRSVDSLRGRIEVTSEPGKGTTFSIQLPLTLAITDGMLVRVGTQRYILPTTRIQTCFRPSAADLTRVLGHGEVVRLHDDLFPLVRLHRLNAVEGAEEDPTKALVVVAGEASRRVALLVDELVGQQQFVVKALTGFASRVPGVTGGSVLGDGTVGLILDPDELCALARNGGEHGAGRSGSGVESAPAA